MPIEFKLPEPIEKQLRGVQLVAENVMRPDSRYLDDHEHERPTRFVSVMWPQMQEMEKANIAAAKARLAAKRAAAMAEKVNLQVRGVIENMAWFTGDDGVRYEIFGAGGGQELADKLDVPLLGQIPLRNDLREGSDEGRPVVAADPGSEASQAFAAIAEQVDVALAPTRRYNPGLSLLNG